MTIPLRPIRSFVKRERNKPKKELLVDKLWPQYGLNNKLSLDVEATFSSAKGSLILEIGFGTGESLFQQAKTYPDQRYIGIEVYHTGILSLLSQLNDQPLPNIRIFEGDAVAILSTCIPDQSLEAIQILFPDPWPKARHHKRRLIQSSFIQQIKPKLKLGGCFYLATDWEHYAHHILQVMESTVGLHNEAGQQQFSERPLFLPQTKFEKRGYEAGRNAYFLCFKRCV
jgi:tRNA (guanine-N7-)-methyltransferase